MKKLVVLALAAAAGLAAAPSSSAAGGLIQPGDYMVAGSAACTTNFVYDGTGSLTGKVYVGTAAHCVHALGEDVRNNAGEVWGDVALIGNPNNAVHDYAFVEVRPAYVGRVRAAMKGHPTLPTGVTTTAETTFGDLVQASGYGSGYSLTTVTQERRQAVLSSDNADTHSLSGPIHFGDSGGPLVHVRTGKALGIVSRLCAGACTEIGPTVQGLLDKAAARGFTVTMRTV